MTDTPLTINPAAAIEKAKEVADRFKRNQSYLITLNTRLPILEAALKQRTKDMEEAISDVKRLTADIAQAKDHRDKLEVWVANNLDMPDDVAQANALAERIKKLQKEIEKKQREMHRLEVGLPV